IGNCAKCELNIFIYKSSMFIITLTITASRKKEIKLLEKTIVVKLITIIVYSATHTWQHCLWDCIVNVLICIMTGQGDIGLKKRMSTGKLLTIPFSNELFMCMNKTIKFVYINQVGWDEMLQNGIIHAAVI
ncbi:hypothetical protein ACJX0J_034307, partial [Zea mays]